MDRRRKGILGNEYSDDYERWLRVKLVMTALNAEMKAQFLSNHVFEEIKMDGYWEAVYP